MNMNELKEGVSSVLGSTGCGAEFYFLIKEGNEWLVRKIDIDTNDHTELEGMFIESIRENILLKDDLSLIPLSGADDRKNAVYEYDLEDVPVQLQKLTSIIDRHGITDFDANVDNIANIKGILILIGNEENTLAIYKHQYPVMIIKGDGGFSIFKPRGESRFKKVGDDILKINASFEFIKIRGKYFIFNIKTLERSFGFHNAVVNVAKKGIGKINEANIVTDTQVFSDRLDDISFARKLVSSAHESPVLGVIPNDKIILFTNSHPALRGQFKYNNNKTKFVLKSKSSQNLFLKLLNDDYLQSELTNSYYDSMAKDKIKSS